MKFYDFTCLMFSVKTFIWSSLMAISSHITSILQILNFLCAVMSRIYWFKIIGNILLNKKITHVSSYKSFFIIEAIFLILHTNPSFLSLPCSHSPQLHLTPSTFHSSERVGPPMLSQFLSLLTDENSVLLISRVLWQRKIFLKI